MKLQDITMYSFKSILKSPLRSWLTIIGMIIGVIAITVILSVSEGFQKSINDQLANFGSNQMIVLPIASSKQALSFNFGRAPTNGKLFERDVESINSIAGIKDVYRTVYGRASLSYKNKSITATIYGSDALVFDQPDYSISSGRFFKDSDRSVAVFGADAAEKLFGKTKVEVGSVITINGVDFRVIGIMKRIGQSLSSSDDNAIYIPFDDGRKVLKGQLLDREINLISLKTTDSSNVNKIKSAIEQKLASNHRVRSDDLDFSVITFEQIQETINGTLGLVQVVLLAVTIIASVVGAIGISNTMFMNVLDKTKEIGVMKALGATGSEILLIFIFESIFIALSGGIIGLIFGYGIGQLLSLVSVPVFLRLRIIAFVLIFSIVVGIFAGSVPAYRASKLDPVEALRD